MTPDSAGVTPAGRPGVTSGDLPAGVDEHGRVRRTRVSGLLIGIVAAALVLIALLVFIAQNSREVTVHYLGFHGHVPLAVALLLAAIAGVLLLAIPGAVRIFQLRRVVKKNVAGTRRS